MTKKYRPSNGSEGSWFTGKFCDCCKHDINSDCKIYINTVIHERTDPGYPREWTYDKEGEPTCTAFEKIQGEK